MIRKAFEKAYVQAIGEAFECLIANMTIYEEDEQVYRDNCPGGSPSEKFLKRLRLIHRAFDAAQIIVGDSQNGITEPTNDPGNVGD